MAVTQDILIRILSAVVLLGLAVFVHEAGHFLIAKKKGVRVEKFSLGFGPKLAGFQKGDTEYLISAVPLGGYIKMAGEDPSAGEGKPDEFFSKPPSSRIKIVLAGPVMNIILAYILTVIVLASGIRVPEYPNILGEPAESLRVQGLNAGDEIIRIENYRTEDWSGIVEAVNELYPEKESAEVEIRRNEDSFVLGALPTGELIELNPFIPAELGEVVAGTPAYSAGLKAGDKILEIDGRPVSDWSGMQRIVSRSPGRELTFKVKRDEETLSFEITPVDIMGDGNAIIGVSAATPEFRVERFGLASIPYALSSNARQIAMSYKMLWLIISRPGEYRQFLGGPVMVVQMAGDEALKGFSDFLSFMAAINIMLAIVNLIPFPVLDGGHILFFLIEMARSRPVPMKVQEAAQRVSLALLILLMVYLVAQDSLRQIDRARVLRTEKTNSTEEP